MEGRVLLLSQIIFWVPYLGFSLIFVVLVYFWRWKKWRFLGLLNLSLYLSIAFFVVDWLSQILILLAAVRNSVFSQELIYSPQSFFQSRAKDISQSFLITLALGLSLYLVCFLIVKYQKKDYLEAFMPKIFLMMALALNYNNILPAILLALVGAIVVQFIFILSRHGRKRASLVPYLLIGAFLIHLMMLLPFYSQILAFFHLV